VERGQIAALKRKIKNADSSTMVKIVHPLLDQKEEIPAEVIQALRDRIQQGVYLDSFVMADLIVRSKDYDLYQIPHTKAMTLGNVDALIKLLSAEIPDGEIEERLCADLERRIDGNDPVWRKYIVEALRDFGSIECLELLEAIDYEFDPKFKTASIITKALDATSTIGVPEDFRKWGARITSEVDLAFGELVKEAIISVRDRNRPRPPKWSYKPCSSTSVFSDARDYADKASSHLNSDLGSALNNLRKATESLLKTLIKIRDIKPKKDKPIEQLELPELLSIIQTELRPPKPIFVQLETLQKQTTLGSHDQGHPVDSFANKDTVSGLISTYNIVEKYFADLPSQ